MKIYTKTGDAGETGLWGGQRVAKDAARVQAYGTVDECNASIGLARAVLSRDQVESRAPKSRPAPEGAAAQAMIPQLDTILATIQNQLFIVGADLATPGEAANIPRVSTNEIAFLEQSIDALEAELAPLKQFVLPGGTLAAAQLHLARTICRRAERWVVSLARQDRAASEHILVYLNRLSDCLFVLARAANARAGVADVPWDSPRQNR
jgi:cob(I)alamin adenosyltransferase